MIEFSANLGAASHGVQRVHKPRRAALSEPPTCPPSYWRKAASRRGDMERAQLILY
jgi:hypothetical protein